MTKQVFDQIADGLREAAETPPAWAMEKADEIFVDISCENDRGIQTKIIARAIADERERAAKIADALPGWQQPRDVAAAIRGSGHE